MGLGREALLMIDNGECRVDLEVTIDDCGESLVATLMMLEAKLGV